MIRHLFLAALFAAASTTAALASSDELYYPASNCQPFDGNGWHGGGSSGFAFLSSVGGLYNFDATHAEALVCPVPYTPRHRRPEPDYGADRGRRSPPSVRHQSVHMRPRLDRPQDLR